MDPLQTLALNDPENWSPVRLWLDFFKTFPTFTKEWGSADSSLAGGALKNLKDVSFCIKKEFENAEREIEDADKKGDPEQLIILPSRLLGKMAAHEEKISNAYQFLSGYVFQNNHLRAHVLENQRWFPSYDSLLSNCESQNLHSGSFLSTNTCLYNDLESILKFLKDLQLRQIMFRDPVQFRDLCIRHGGVAICLAGLLFSCWVDKAQITTASAKAKLSDLVVEIKPASRDIMAQYLEAIKSQIHSLQGDLMVELVGITLLIAPNGPLLPSATSSLVFLIKHLVDSGKEDDAKIRRIVCDASSEEAEFLMTKILLTELGDGLSIRDRPRFNDPYSENMMQILEEVETLMMMSEAEADPDPYIKVSLDFYIAVFQAFLMELLNRSSILIMDVKFQVQKLSKESKRFRRYSSVLPLRDPAAMELISNLMLAATQDAETLYIFFQSNLDVVGNMNDLSRLLSMFLEQLTVLNDEVEEIYLKFRGLSMASFPNTLPGLSFVDSFLERLSGMVESEFRKGYSIVGAVLERENSLKQVLKGEIENSLAQVLKKVEEKQNENPELTDLKRRVSRAAYEADYIIDSMLVFDADKCHMLWLSDALNEMNSVREDLMRLCGKKSHLVQNHAAVETLDQDEPAQSHDTEESSGFIIPLDEQVSEVTKLLKIKEAFIVGIAGEPGIGKTTLARTVYDRVKVDYQKHAWCYISQQVHMRNVMLKILRDIDPKLIEDIKESENDAELLKKVNGELRGKTYLIVLDDIWSADAWQKLAVGVPVGQEGCRIMFTSRTSSVLSSYKAVVYTPKGLSPEESWSLLEGRVFGTSEGLKCPEGLRKVGREIARDCRGLPLAIVSVSGVLRNVKEKPQVWYEIKRQLSSIILQDPQSQCTRILELSYNHLPDYLKPCLLYFAAFHEDQEIQINRLTRLWISEGLVRQVHPKSESEPEDVEHWRMFRPIKVKPLEDVAMDYVEDLTSRSLIMPTRRSASTNKTKACKIHDMLHSLCTKKARDDKYFESITEYAGLYPSNTEDHGIGIKPFNGTPQPSYTTKHRIGIFSRRNQFVNLQPSGPPVRTLLFSPTPDTHPTCPYDVSFIPRNFKILKVLDIQKINMDSSFPENILDLDPLRYLAVGGDIISIPEKIHRLWNLENFIVRGLKGRVAFPRTIWRMSKLRHLHVYPGLTLDFGGDGKLHNLMTLSTPSLLQWEDLEAIVEKAPRLQKLKCTFSPDSGTKFESSKDLKQLQSLKVIYTGQSQEAWELTFPSRLIKLSLKSFCLTLKCISSIGNLSRLEVLTLVSTSFHGSKWEMGEDEFPELRILKLDSLDLREWIAPSSNFEQLERLVMRNCNNLQQLPSSFAYIGTLKEIDLMQCISISQTSLVDIGNDRDVYAGSDTLKITFNRSKIFPEYLDTSGTKHDAQWGIRYSTVNPISYHTAVNPGRYLINFRGNRPEKK